MSAVPITLTLGNLTLGANYQPQQFAQAIVDRLTASISDGNILFGQMGGTSPTSAVAGANGVAGLWLNGNVLYAWNTDAAKYLPLPVTSGQLLNGTVVLTSIQCGATVNRTLTTPDKDGTIAVTTDIVSYLGTHTLTAAATVNIDWSVKQPAYLVLGQNTAITQTGGVDGQEQELWIENPPSGIYTVTFSSIIWPNGDPVMNTSSGATERKINRFVFKQIGTNVFGRVSAGGGGGTTTAYSGASAPYVINTVSGTGADTTPPTVASVIGKGTVITITMSELIQGGTLTTSQFAVIKNGGADTVTSAIASGNTITLSLGTSFNSAAIVTVQYTGTSIKDLAGNPAANFGPSTVTYGTAGGGNQNSPS